MKKLLLTLALSVMTLSSFYAQSLTLVACGGAGSSEPEVPADANNTLNGDYTFNGFFDQFMFNFYVKNNSSQGGVVTVVDVSPSNDLARTYTPLASLCYNNLCYPAGSWPSFNIEANGEYRGSNTGDITQGSGMDLQASWVGERVPGIGQYRIEFKFEHDAESCVFFVNIDFKNPSGVASAEVLGNLRVYQDAAGNVVADYGFGNDGDRTLSIVSLSGQKVYECPVDGASGTMTLPVDLGRGVYLYSVTEGGQLLSSHKFVVR